ncbi:hypothetical protein BGX38DRAFT_1273021 [Terfezia claveryi]|nr:hypothetical protein BGX38DRAFT_1273021 [Terfezia claveryi]
MRTYEFTKTDLLSQPCQHDLDSYSQRLMPRVSNKRKLEEMVKALDEAFEGLIEEIGGGDADLLEA